MENSIHDNVFCVDCNGRRSQRLAGKNIYDGTLRYICPECGCENNVEDSSGSQTEK